MSTGNSQNDATVSPVRLFPHDNPCPNPQLPPLLIETDGPYVPRPGDRMRRYCHRTIMAYQKQATNMTQLDQKEYLSLLQASYFKMPEDTPRGLAHHPLYSKLQTEPTWAKFVFLSALYPEILVIKGQPTPFQQQMISAFKSLDIKNDSEGYEFSKSSPQHDDDQDKVLSSPPSGPHPNPLDVLSTMQNAIMKLDEKLDATREEMRQQREQHENTMRQQREQHENTMRQQREQHENTMRQQHEQHEKAMLMKVDAKLDTARKEMTEIFKTEAERILQLYSRNVSEVVDVARNNDMAAIRSELAVSTSYIKSYMDGHWSNIESGVISELKSMLSSEVRVLIPRSINWLFNDKFSDVATDIKAQRQHCSDIHRAILEVHKLLQSMENFHKTGLWLPTLV
ncbi:hypothetical protein HDV62DRAFT_290413 [Trichoderma sp. SZMC 28011]